MPRDSFFKELKIKKVCLNCREGFHEGCSPEVVVSKEDAWPVRKRGCACECQLTPYEKLKIARAKREKKITK
ncbi:MAG: hypothetical protein WBD93_14895 [Acidobacteriaceae bacterium]|jgi:hypothetical protein